jgi:hypothetical protein
MKKVTGTAAEEWGELGVRVRLLILLKCIQTVQTETTQDAMQEGREPILFIGSNL